MTSLSQERAVTPDEAAVIRWLIEHAAVKDVTAYQSLRLEDLRVVGGCTCGCRSLYFQPLGAPAHMIADALAVYPDGYQAGVILWGREGQISNLEIYEMHPEVARLFPEVSNLRTWEGRGLELLETESQP